MPFSLIKFFYVTDSISDDFILRSAVGLLVRERRALLFFVVFLGCTKGNANLSLLVKGPVCWTSNSEARHAALGAKPSKREFSASLVYQ